MTIEEFQGQLIAIGQGEPIPADWLPYFNNADYLGLLWHLGLPGGRRPDYLLRMEAAIAEVLGAATVADENEPW